jgi:hypothetical protein
MNTYEVRLESPTSSQFRLHSIHADTAEDARQIAQAHENKLLGSTLFPPPKDEWEQGVALRHAENGDAHIDLNAWDAHLPQFVKSLKDKPYEEHVSAANWRLEQLAKQVQFTRDGKMRTSLTGRAKARYLAHLQSDPFDISDVREVPQGEIDANDLVRQVRALHENDPQAWARTLERLREAGVPLAAVTAALYGTPTKNREDGTANGQVSWKTGGDTFKTSLHTVSYAYNQDTDAFFSTPTNEITGTGYTAGGTTLGSLASSYDSTSDQARFDAADATWASSTLTARVAVVYKSTGTASTSPLIGYVDFGANVSTTSDTLTITWDSTSVWLLDVT